MDSKPQEYSIGEHFGLFGDEGEEPTAENIRKVCTELVSHPGRYQGLSPEEAYYHVIAMDIWEPVITVSADDFEIWGSSTLFFACAVDGNGFAVVQRFMDEESANAWLDEYQDANGGNC